jgi:hypothetical protein
LRPLDPHSRRLIAEFLGLPRLSDEAADGIAFTLGAHRAAHETKQWVGHTPRRNANALRRLDKQLSAFAVESAMSSSSQRRPRAIAATNLARVSERIGRTCSGRIPSGRRISRRRFAVIFRQGTARVFVGSPSWMINWSCWTSTRET